MHDTQARKLAEAIQTELGKLKPELIIDQNCFNFQEDFAGSLKRLRQAEDENLDLSEPINPAKLFPHDTISLSSIGNEKALTALNDILATVTVKLRADLNELAYGLQDFLKEEDNADALDEYSISILVTLSKGGLRQENSLYLTWKLWSIFSDEALQRIKAAIKWN